MSNDSGFTARTGAVGDPPLHYGNPLGEQRALEQGRAVVALDHDVIALTGPDRLSWLDSLTTQSIAHLQPGQSAETLLLDPSGRIEHAMRVLDDGETTYLIVDGPRGDADARPADALQTFLSRMVFMLRVEVSRSESRAVGVFGSGLTLPSELVWTDPWAEVVTGGWQYAAAEGHPSSEWDYREVLVSPDADLSGFDAAGTLALEALRIAAWRPRIGDADERTIPHELDWLRSAVHLNKGCYRGQETVAKVHNLGHPPRRAVLLHLDGSDGVLPASGAEVRIEDAVVGHVSAAALHHEYGPIALAVVKRSVDPAADLVVAVEDAAPIAAAQQVIVPPDAGSVADVPRLPRLGARR